MLLPIGMGYEIVEGNEELLPTISSGERVSTIQDFQSLAGCLLWCGRCTRPDIMFAVHCVTRKTHAPTDGDMKMAKKILRYLKGTQDLKLEFKGKAGDSSQVVVSAYSDADWADNKADRKSVSGAVILVNDVPVHWACKKQTAVALSTMEAELVASAQAIRKVLGLQEQLQELLSA